MATGNADLATLAQPLKRSELPTPPLGRVTYLSTRAIWESLWPYACYRTPTPSQTSNLHARTANLLYKQCIAQVASSKPLFSGKEARVTSQMLEGS